MSDRFRMILACGLIPLAVILDQWTKYLVLSEPRFNSLGCLDRTQACGKIELSPCRGSHHGLEPGHQFRHRPVRRALCAGSCLRSRWRLRLAFRCGLFRATRWLTGLALALVVGGAIGNMIDRVRFGAVVDFIDFSDVWFKYVFNVADSAVTVGAALLFLDQFLLAQDEKKTGSLSE